MELDQGIKCNIFSDKERVKGDIICSKRLELSSTARVIGNVEAPILVVLGKERLF